MIENDHQLHITQTKLKQFEETLAKMKELPAPTTKREALELQLKVGSLTGFIEEFKQEIADYLKQTAL